MLGSKRGLFGFQISVNKIDNICTLFENIKTSIRQF